jgi:hypothetical protein
MDGNTKEQNKAQMFRFTSINALLLPLLSLKNASPETCLAGRPRGQTRSRPLCSLYQNLFDTSVRSVALRLAGFFGSTTLRRNLLQMEIIKLR